MQGGVDVINDYERIVFEVFRDIAVTLDVGNTRLGLGVVGGACNQYEGVAVVFFFGAQNGVDMPAVQRSEGANNNSYRWMSRSAVSYRA